ncbi:hypothetical protein RDI58_022432 [Solanum bulbocastanum]|uniref:Uncharacterized protein n=1 Tax=Solanum bulbocastanum TaxID=147425 RepID=A0AAN8T9A2_SOLBU
MIGCPFVLLISQDGKGPGFRVKTLKPNHNCEDAFKNLKACNSTLAQYFKSKLQNNPQYKLKDMRKDWKFLRSLHNKIEAYANELRLSNPGSDIVINLSKDALEQEHVMYPPNLVKSMGRTKTKRTREKDATIKRVGEWAHSRKGTKITCREQGATLKKKRGRTEEEPEEEVDVNSSAPNPTQDEKFMPTPGLSQQQYEPFGPSREPKSGPDIRPQLISENGTKLKMRIHQQRETRNRVISFRGDHAGISEPTDLSYSPTKLTWKGKEIVTGNQLEKERQKKVGKLKTRKANGKSQI